MSWKLPLQLNIDVPLAIQVRPDLNIHLDKDVKPKSDFAIMILSSVPNTGKRKVIIRKPLNLSEADGFKA